MKNNAPSMDNAQYQSHVDGLRAWAVVSVLLFHLGVNGFLGGFVGVDVFFVISGFLITRLIRSEIENTGTFSFKNFYLRRVRRLLPAYLLTLTLTTFAAALLFSPSHLERYGVALSTAVASVSNFYFWFEADYFDVSAQKKPLLHTWTLGVEEQFYFVWPLFLVFLYTLGARKWVPSVLILIVALSLYLNVIFGDGEVGLISHFFPRYGATLISNGKSTLFFLLPFRLFEFMIGALLVWIAPSKIENRVMNELLFWVGMAMVLYAVVFFNETMLFPSYFALIPCLGASFLIYTGDKVFAAAILRNKCSVSIGLISYSLYLVHWPIVVFWQYVKVSEELVFFDKLGIVVVSFFFALISYYLVEKPFRKKTFSIGIKKWKVAIPFCVVLFGLGFHMNITGGWPRSVPYTVNFDNVGSAANYQKKYNGGAGYPDVGAVNTDSLPNVILMGDSHGKHYAEGIYKEFSQPNGLALYIVSGNSCFHLPGFTRTTQGKNWDRLCPNAVRKAIEFSKMAKKTPIVIVSHSWISQLNRADLLDSEGRRRNIDVGVDDVLRGIDVLKAMIEPATLVVIGNVPASNGRNLYDIFTRPSVVSSPDFVLDDYLTSDIRPLLWEFNKALEKAANETGHFVFLDPFDVLCDDEKCINVDKENYLLYSDTSHLSKYGAKLVIKMFLPDLMLALKSAEK